MIFLVILAVGGSTLLFIRRQQQNSKIELEQQAELVIDTLSASAVTPIYFLDVDQLSDLGERVVKDPLVVQTRFYDAMGRILSDSNAPTLAPRLESDPFGQQLLESNNIIFKWQSNQLLAGRAIIVEDQQLGAVSLNLSTTQLEDKVVAIRNQGFSIALGMIAVGVLLALFLSRSITTPLQKLMEATYHIAQGDLTQKITVTDSSNEVAVLGKSMEQMRVELQELYQSLEQTVSDRTTDLLVTNKNLQREIVEHKQTEKALILARDQALQANRFKTELLAKVSHELRTPLGVILGYSEFLQDGMFGDLSDQQEKAISEVIDSTFYLTNIVGELLDQSQIEAGQLTLTNEPFSPRHTLDQVKKRMDVLAQDKGLTLITNVAPNVPAILSGDPTRIQQILVNLVGNAIKFTQQGEVQVCICMADATHWSLQVSDTGSGIPEKFHAHIFESFGQVDGSTTRAHSGTGLGLSIVKQLTTLMGGQINLESEVDQGSTFTILLPLNRT